MKAAAEDHGVEDTGQQEWIRRWRICGTATDEIWDEGDSEIGRKDCDGLGNYRQGTTTNLRAYCSSGIMGIEDKVSSEDIGG